MGLLQKAYETFEANEQKAGMPAEEGKQPLCPVGHAIQKAQIEILLNRDGVFQQAREVPPEKCQTIIPTSEESAARTSGLRAHPLCDQLMYVSDYFARDGKEEGNSYQQFLQTLESWASFSTEVSELQTVLHYVKGQTIVQDLVHSGLIESDENGKPDSKGKLAQTEYAKCLVRWVIGGEPVWENQRLMKAWLAYYLEMNVNRTRGTCMITGEKDVILATSHDKGVISIASGAKLLSSNDRTNFVFAGRFSKGNPDEACSISYLASQKAMKALRWVASNEGVIRAGRTYVCWNPGGRTVFNVMSPIRLARSTPITVEDSYRKEIRDVLSGYSNKLPANEGVVIAAFDAATTGRLSLCYYNELMGSDFYDKVEKWYSSVAWYAGNFGYFGMRSPSLYDIANYAFGTERNNKVEADPGVAKGIMNSLLRCLLEGAPIPQNVLKAITNNAGEPQRYSFNNQWTLLGIACALIRKYRNDQLKKEEWTMALEADKKDRSYQFGRLLAVLERVETSTYGKDNEREPNASKLRQRYRERPMDTAEKIEAKLQPYFKKMGPGLTGYYKDQISRIMDQISQFPESEWNKPLEDTYLMGYYLQRIEGRKNTNDTEEKNEMEEN